MNETKKEKEEERRQEERLLCQQALDLIVDLTQQRIFFTSVT